MTTRVLVLGGTTEASEIVAALASEPDLHVVLSLAGRTERPAAHPVPVRVGGFGGVDGLVRHLSEAAVDLLVDATHPFAAVMGVHAAQAGAVTGIPRLKVVRPAWEPEPGDRWTSVADVAAAAAELARQSPRRALLTVGRQELEPFRTVPVPLLVRSIDPPDLTGFRSARVLLERGPFSLDHERDLLRREAIDVLVTKNSGGRATAPKLAAARELGVAVVMVERPAVPSGAQVGTAADAVAWVLERARAR
jgi:precorrin-6A/cobalt-precorrin-6A reductase